MILFLSLAEALKPLDGLYKCGKVGMSLANEGVLFDETVNSSPAVPIRKAYSSYNMPCF